MKTILSIIPYTHTEHDLFVLREPIKDKPSRHFFKSIPEWCVRNNGSIDYTENYHQFTGLLDSKEETVYYLFDINPVDEILKEEISQVGVVELFEGYDWNPLFNKIPTLQMNALNSLRIPANTHVVVELNYFGSGEDFETAVEVLGYLDNKMDFVRI